MRGAIARLFWSEERREREAPRRRERAVWVHPALSWIVSIGLLVGSGVSFIPHHQLLVRLLLGLPYVVVFVALGANGLVIRRRRREGWTPVDGIHTPPVPEPGQSPIAVSWRWLVHRESTDEGQDRLRG